MVSERADVYKYIHEPIFTGSLGEGYSIRNTNLKDTVRFYVEPEYLYDAMNLIYECTTLNFYQDMFGFELIRDNDGKYKSTLYLEEWDVYPERYWIDLVESGA